MGDYMSELPDDIFCYLISYLTVRDSFRVRSLLPSWKDLPDTRSVLQFDAYTILGNANIYSESLHRPSKFVKAVNQFFKTWRAPKTSALKIKYGLGNGYASHIDGWIASVNGKELEELDLDFSDYADTKADVYVFPCHLLDAETYLKHLQLKCCDLTLNCDASTNWLSKLSTVELAHVSLCPSDIQCILSSSLNLESLTLSWVSLDLPLCIRHPSLKKLVISGECRHVELSCPQLETFEFSGRSNFTFSNAPLLKDASLKLHFTVGGCSAEFSVLARNVPMLHTLSLWVTTEVIPLPPTVAMSCLKRLDLLVTNVPTGFDLFSITHMLYASPVLEALHLKLEPNGRMIQRSKKQYPDRPHLHLKEFTIEGLRLGFSIVELAEYLLRNVVSLKQLVFIADADSAEYVPIARGEPRFIMLQNINPAVEVTLI